jgi:signal peptidase
MIKLTKHSIVIAAVLAALVLTHTILLFLAPAFYGSYFEIVRPVSYVLILVFAWLCLGKNMRTYPGQKTFILVGALGLIVYLAFNFIAGLVVGFGHNAMNISLIWILRNSWSYILIIAIRELLRGLTMSRVSESHKYWKMLIIALIFSFISLDNLGAVINNGLYLQIDWIFTSLLPVLVLNLYLTYAALHGGLKGNLVFVLGVNLLLFFSPILPDIPNILDAIAIYSVTFIMFIIYDSIEWRAKRSAGIDVVYKDRRRWWWTIPPGGLVIVSILFGLGVFPVMPVAVVSNSMEREFKRGDIIYVERVCPSEVKVGDVMQYTHNGIAIVHRVMEIRYDTTLGRFFVLQGDENPRPDPWPVFDHQVVGVVNWRTPLIGWPTVIFQEMRQQ